VPLFEFATYPNSCHQELATTQGDFHWNPSQLFLIDENPKAAQIQGPMTRGRTKQSKDTLQQMVATIFDKAQVEKDKGSEALPRILIAEGPN